jgi:hypothetical protein
VVKAVGLISSVSGETVVAKFNASTPNAQNAAIGAYLGVNSGPALELADGANTYRVDINATNLRWLKAGVAVLMTLDLTGKLSVSGSVGFNGTAPLAKPTVTGAKGSNAALASLLTALAATGILTDSSTA